MTDEGTVSALVDLVRRAGDAVLAVYETPFEVTRKDDDSPLTRADLASHEIIAAGLRALAPEVPLLSEESVPPAFATRRSWRRYWLVDPLDGTKEFVNRNGEFTVNIALVEAHRPVLGVVGVPVTGVVYTGRAGAGAHRHDGRGVHPLHGRRRDPARPPVVVASRSHGGERLERYLADLARRFPGVTRKPVGSSLKLCILAEGEADIYPRLGPTSEWDIAAAHAVLLAAGGAVWGPDGHDLSYNSGESLLNPDFLAVADGSYPWRKELPALE